MTEIYFGWYIFFHNKVYMYVFVSEKFQNFSSFGMKENNILENLYIQFVDVNSIAKEYRYNYFYFVATI